MDRELVVGQTTPVRFALAGDAVLSGEVSDELTGTPIAGATVRIANTPFTTVTKDSGRFRFFGLHIGDTEITVSADGFREQSVTRELAGKGEETLVVIAMAGDATMTANSSTPASARARVV